MKAIDYKRIGLIVAVALCATLTWAAARSWLEGPARFSSWEAALVPSLAVVLFAAVAAIAWMLLDRPLERLASMLASWATFIVFWKPDIWYLSALPVLLFFWYEASRRIQGDMVDRRKLRVNATLGQGAKFILLGAFLMASLGFYLLPSSRTADFRVVSKGLQSSLESTYDQPLVQQQLSQLPSGMQVQVKRDLARFVDDWVKGVLGPLGPLVPPILAFALFLALWSVSFIYREAAIWVGVGLFALLKAVKFVRVEERDVKAEVLSL
ncbi:MAG: hypothetical protein IT406_01335 [Candidatus Yanofskybacteria bacterium]|nr:hypothetical protein [Candidatus Yanofskybacteria bacterium]